MLPTLVPNTLEQVVREKCDLEVEKIEFSHDTGFEELNEIRIKPKQEVHGVFF